MLPPDPAGLRRGLASLEISRAKRSRNFQALERLGRKRDLDPGRTEMNSFFLDL
jgi:hypothetical protein